MDSVESNPETFNLEGAIMKTTELIQRLSRAEQSTSQQKKIIQAKLQRMETKIDGGIHFELKYLVDCVLRQIVCLEQFPYQAAHYYGSLPPSITPPPPPTPKELAEPVQRAKIQFHHNNKSLATERKMARELRQRESKRQQLLQAQADEADMQSNLYRDCKHMPDATLECLIRSWAEKVEHVSSLVLRESKNLSITKLCYELIEDLKETGKQFYWPLHIDEDQFRKHWDSMTPPAKNSIAQTKLDLARESMRLEEDYAKSQRLHEKTLELKQRSGDMFLRLRNIRQQKLTASNHLLNLQIMVKEEVSTFE